MKRKREKKLQAVSFELQALKSQGFHFILKGKMKNFKQLLIWQKGLKIAVRAYELVSSFPKEERFSLSNQITRAAVSISSNIAEGSSRESEKDYRRFLQISFGSCYELETQLLIAESVNYGYNQLRGSLLSSVQEEQRMLTGFKGKLAK